MDLSQYREASDLLPPTHPNGPRRMVDVVRCQTTRDSQGCGHPVDWHTGPDSPAQDCPCCSWRKEEAPARTMPVRTPPPPGFPSEKWEMMSRRERRAATKGRSRAR
jgi:hypothetical protein